MPIRNSEYKLFLYYPNVQCLPSTREGNAADARGFLNSESPSTDPRVLLDGKLILCLLHSKVAITVVL